MKITIDTKEDSHEEIKKVISMLQALVGGQEKTYSNKDIFSDSSPEITPSASGGIFGNIFDSNKIDSVEEKKEAPEPEENVEIVPYH